MNTYNYEMESIILDPIKLLKILELVKIPTLEYVVIPRILYQRSFENCIFGVNNRTIYNISKYDELDMEDHIVLWNDPSIHYISFSINQILPFIKALKENLNEIGDITLYYHKYNVNNQNMSLATLISAKNKIQIKNSQGLLDWVPSLELNNYKDILFHLRYLLDSWNKSNCIMKKSLKDDKEFREIWDKKTSEGAMAWIPNPENYDENMKPYIIYLSKTMFAVSKADDVILEIRDEVPDESYDKFLIKFTVIKKKAKGICSYHDYYMMGIKMLNFI